MILLILLIIIIEELIMQNKKKAKQIKKEKKQKQLKGQKKFSKNRKCFSIKNPQPRELIRLSNKKRLQQTQIKSPKRSIRTSKRL